ncbi:restriction endonuclease subunit S [Tenacibaculum maritimum]|uniref:Type I restriction-modification enzyme S subunit, HsdS family n=1 Tax=Tenacibaculum maritimum NCIMB 2154 TaxID=1349785 RepID=A0A2H1EBR6_9FLAO|nr:restriction endonuclease subunit S [Tenacibaculum maritimum]SFZ83865.1 Type I restriction-modification enzyme S subunit, HsdS family [Tenacibaculum maritimum NCIMB 2154]
MELTTKQGFKQTEVGLIPEDWLVISLSEAVEFLDGKRRPIKANERVSGNYPYYGASGIIDYVNDYIFDDELILLGEDGENILSRNLPLAFIIKGKAWVNNHAHVMKPNKFFNINFLTEYLESLDYSLLNSGTAQPKLNKKSCLNIRVIAPPIKEQKAIATALSDMDDLIASLESLIAKKQAIKQGAMQQLLTPPHKGGKRLPGFSGEWVEKKLGEKADFYKGKGLPKSDIIEEGKYKCIHYGELFTNYNHIITSVRSRTNENSDIFLSKENDVLMPTSDVTPNGLATASALFEDDIILGGDVLVIRPNKSLYGAFLSYQISMNKQQIMSLISGTTVYHLYGSDMSKFNFHIPKIDEQKAIIRILYDMEVEITQLETKKAKYQQLKQGMLEELLTGNTRLV